MGKRQTQYRARGQVRAGLLLTLLVLVLCLPSLAQAERDVVILNVRGAIDPVVAAYVQRGISAAVQADAQCVILEIDTPGGLDTSMRQIVQSILSSPIPIIAYVAPSGARAASAGLFITYACHVASMAPGTNIGAAHPVGGNATELPATIADKAVNDAVAYIRSLAEEQGRNAEWAEQAVRQSVSIPASEAREAGVVEIIAANRNDLLRQLEGREVRMPDGNVVLRTIGAGDRQVGMTPQETILHVIVDPSIAYLLLTIGIWGLILEFSAPGISAGGIIGVICLILFGVSVASLPLNWAGLALIGMSIILFILETQIASQGLLTIGGILAFVLGSLFLFNRVTPSAPGGLWPAELSSISRWLIALMTGLTAGLFLVAVGAGVWAQRRRPRVGEEALIGATGLAQTDCAPVGTVQVNGELWSARAIGDYIRAGERVQVVEREGLVLQVKRIGS